MCAGHRRGRRHDRRRAGRHRRDRLPDERVAAGLLRLTVERMRALGRAEADVSPIVTRRRDGRVVLLATEPYLLDLAEWAGREADSLVAAAGDPATALVPARRVAERMRAASTPAPSPRSRRRCANPRRLAQLGAAVSSRAALSAGGDLHSRDLRQSAALALTFKDFAGGQPLTPQEIRDRVRVRFPALAPLPQRPPPRRAHPRGRSGPALRRRHAGLPDTPGQRRHDRPANPAC